jgi:hypothetical protein
VREATETEVSSGCIGLNGDLSCRCLVQFMSRLDLKKNLGVNDHVEPLLSDYFSLVADRNSYFPRNVVFAIP